MSSLPHVSPGPASDHWLTADERACPAVPQSASLDDVLMLFEGHQDMRLLAVVDGDARPVGAITDRGVRSVLLNPFGRALSQNPAYGDTVAALVRPVPVADAELPIGELVALYRRAGGTEGMILTRAGRLHAVIQNRL